MWFNDDGNDVSVKFFLPGDVVSSLDSFYLGVPSKFGIETIVPTTVRSSEERVLLDRLANAAGFKDQMIEVAVHCISDYQELFLNRIVENPEHRYRTLMERQPELFETVPHHYIASYLGITPVSLSRIRKRIAQN